MEIMHGADKSEIHRRAVVAFHRSIAPADEDIPAMESDSPAAKAVDRVHKVAVHHVEEHAFYDADSLFVGDAQPADEFCLHAGIGHGLVDGLAPSVDDHRIDTGQFHEDNIAQE